MEEEIWKPVVGYEGLYEVSSLGRVKSFSTHCHKEPKILKPLLTIWGYHYINLCRNRKHKPASIHRLVATAFIPNPNKLPVINHKNGVKTDNRAENLEWCTPKENTRHSIEVLGKKPKGNNQYGGPKPVRCVETGVVYKSIMEASRATGLSDGIIRLAVRHQTRTYAKGYTFTYHTAGGYHWEFV